MPAVISTADLEVRMMSFSRDAVENVPDKARSNADMIDLDEFSTTSQGALEDLMDSIRYLSDPD